MSADESWPSTHASQFSKLRVHNADAWNDLVFRYQQALMAFCRRRYGLDADVADEIVQVVFVKLLSAIKVFEYTADSNFRAYLKKVCQTAVADFFRTQSKNGANGSGDSRVLGILNNTPEMQQELADAMTIDFHRQLLYEAEKHVRPKLKNEKNWDAYIELKEGKTGAQVAESLEMTVDAVYKARQRIVTWIKQYVARRLKQLAAE